MADLVVGADIGGTSTRVAVADLDGHVLSMASGGPGNPTTVGLNVSAAEIRFVMDRALAPLAGQVVSVVIGLAGGSRAAGSPDFLRAAVSQRIDVPAELVGDLTVAFCSATPAREGYVIVAGTGAVAGQVVDAELVQQRDGWGWLLGDAGSGFWLGRAAVRSTLDALQRGARLGPLQRDVLAATGAAGYQELLQLCYSSAPTWLAQFSPLVTRHAAGDLVAAGISDGAVDRLEALAFTLPLHTGDPIVLAGSVLTTPGPISSGLRARLARRVDNPVLTSTTGVVGALWLALGGGVRAAPSVHRSLVDSAGRWLAESR